MARDYTTLITSQHKDKPKFLATVALTAGAFGQVSDAAAALVPAFDLDTAVGVQLNILGLWIGITRRLLVPIEGAWFTWDDPDLGWDQANWQGPFESSQGITVLDDETYRAVLRAKVGSNYWNGSNMDLNVIAGEALRSLGVHCYVIDNMDMSVTVYILGTPTAALIELIKRGITPPKPAGVRVASYILASTPGAPIFALSVPTTPITAGLDFGSFGDPV